MNYCYFDTDIGRLLLAGDAKGLTHIGFPTGKGHVEPHPEWELLDTAFDAVKRQLSEYLASERREFDLPLNPSGTAFQKSVLKELLRIPYGETASYAQIAKRIGRPKAVRAVGAANGRNPIPIVIPCHRVIGSDGSLTGFGGGLELKARLLRMEQESSGLFARH